MNEGHIWVLFSCILGHFKKSNQISTLNDYIYYLGIFPMSDVKITVLN